MHFFPPLLAILASLAVTAASSSSPWPLKTKFPPDVGIRFTDLTKVHLYHSTRPLGDPLRSAPSAEAQIVRKYPEGHLEIEFYNGDKMQERVHLLRNWDPNGFPIQLHFDHEETAGKEHRLNMAAKILDYCNKLPQSDPIRQAESAKVAITRPDGPMVVHFYKHRDPTLKQGDFLGTRII